MNVHGGADNQTQDRNSVADLLKQRSSRSKSGRCDVGAAVVVDDDTDGDVCRGHDALAPDQGLGEVTGLAHFGHDVEVRRHTSVGEND